MTKTVDYFMKFIDHNTQDTSLVALETLQAFFRTSPASLYRHKARFKAVWKSSKDKKVKDMCVRILPEIQPVPG